MLELAIIIAALLIVFGKSLAALLYRIAYEKDKRSAFIGYMNIRVDKDGPVQIPCMAAVSRLDSSSIVRITGYINPAQRPAMVTGSRIEVVVFEENANGQYQLATSNIMMREHEYQKLVAQQINPTIKMIGYIPNLMHTKVDFNMKLNIGSFKFIEEIEVLIPTDKFLEWVRAKQDYLYIKSSDIGN